MYCRTAVCQAGPGLELLLLVERGRQAALLAECPTEARVSISPAGARAAWEGRGPAVRTGRSCNTVVTAAAAQTDGINC